MTANHAIAHEHVEPASATGIPHDKMGMWVFLCSEIMFFTGLIGSYIVLRFASPTWPHPGNTLNERRAMASTPQDREPMMTCEELAETIVHMAALPPHVNMLEAIVLPVEQLYVGRG